MGRTRQTGNLTADALLVNDIANDLVKVGTGITFFGGAVGIVSALSFYGDGSNLSGVATGGGTGRRRVAGVEFTVVVVGEDPGVASACDADDSPGSEA